MAASADRTQERQPSEYCFYRGSSGTKIYSGTFVMRTNAGVIQAGEGGASTSSFLGVADNQADLSATQTGITAINVKVWKTGEFTVKALGTGATTDIGQKAYLHNDETVGVSYGTPNLVVGEITGIPSTSTYRVRITNAVGNWATNA